MPIIQLRDGRRVEYPDDWSRERIKAHIISRTEGVNSSTPAAGPSRSELAAQSLERIGRGEDVPPNAVQPAKEAAWYDPRPHIAGAAARGIGLLEGTAALPAMAYDYVKPIVTSDGFMDAAANMIAGGAELAAGKRSFEDVAPATSAVSRYGDQAIDAVEGGLNSLGEPIDMEVTMAANRLAGDIVAPGPEILQAGKLAKRAPSLVDNAGREVVEDVPQYLRKDWRIEAREAIEDDMIRVKKLMDDPSVEVSEVSDAYLAEELFHGRVGARIEDAKQTFEKIDQEVVQLEKRHGIGENKLTEEVDRFMKARHAPERNAKHGEGAAGMTSAQADAEVERIMSTGYGEDVKRIADKFREMDREGLDILNEGGVIGDDLYRKLNETYEYHVPLQRIMDDEDDFAGVFSGRPRDVRSTGIMRAKGSDRETRDIASNIVYNYQRAVERAEKNRADLATLQFSRDNPDLGLFNEIRPKAIGKDFNGRILTEKIDDDNVLQLFENGKPVYLKIEDDAIAAALRGVNHADVPELVRQVGKYTRYVGMMATRFNPAFSPANKLRDIGEVAPYVAKQMGFRAAAKTVLRDMGSVGSLGTRGSMRGVYDAMTGTNSEGALLYRQMRADGGTTGGMALSTRKDLELDLDKIRLINRSSPRKAADLIVKKMDAWNAVFEDSTRLSVYRTALEEGYSRPMAAKFAKTASVNFNKMGTQAPILKSLYLFINPGIQGSAKMMRSLLDKKVAAATLSSILGAVAATSEWNDTVDPEWRSKVSEWDRNNSLTIALPGSKEDDKFKYIAIPTPWGLKPIKVAADLSWDMWKGHKKEGGIMASAAAIGGATLEGYNPVGGTDAWSAAMPTLGDLPLEVLRNKTWYDGRIRPDYPGDDRDRSLEYYGGLNETAGGRAAIGATEALSPAIEISPADLHYVIGQLAGGGGRFAAQLAGTARAATTGEMPEARDTPFVSRFLREREDRIYSKLDPELQDAKVGQDNEKARKSIKADQLFSEVREMEAGEREKFMDSLDASNPALHKRVQGKLDKFELTPDERGTKNLGVKNLARARYVSAKMSQMSPQEAEAYLDGLIEKGVVSDDVLYQINVMRR